jgi:hypothetical protein
MFAVWIRGMDPEFGVCGSVSIRIRVQKNFNGADPYWFMKYCYQISILKGAEWFSKKFIIVLTSLKKKN